MAKYQVEMYGEESGNWFDSVGDYVEGESAEDAIATAIQFLLEQAVDNGFRDEQDLAVIKDGGRYTAVNKL